MQLFVVTAYRHDIITSVGRYDTLAAAWRGVQLFLGGAWVGPPRVVRHSSDIDADVYITGVLSFPDPPPGGHPHTAADVQNVLAPRVKAALDAVTLNDGWSVAVAPYLDAVNGADLSWWSSGQASQSRTRDNYPSAVGAVTDAPENPVGPDALHPNRSLSDELGGAARGLGGAVADIGAQIAGTGAKILGVIVLGAGLWYLGPVVFPALAAAIGARTKRKNPKGEFPALPAVAAVGAGGAAYYLATHAGGAAPAPAPAPAPSTTPAPAPRASSTPTPAPATPPVLPTTLTDAERALSRDLISGDIARKLRFYFQATMYSWNATNEAPSGLDSPETQRLTSLVQTMRGADPNGVLDVATIRDTRRFLDTIRRAAGNNPVRKLPFRLWREATTDVNNAAMGVAPGGVLLQVDSLDA